MFLKIRPRTKQRPRLGRRRKAYTPAATVEFEKAIGDAWDQQHPEPPLEGPVGMAVEIGTDYVYVEVYDLESSHRPKYITGDLDNYHKSISDGLNGKAFKDDKQVQYIDLRFTKDVRGDDWQPDLEEG